MQVPLAFRPLAAKIGLCRSPIGTSPVMKRTADAVVVEIAARRDHFGLD
jgi:hypothetical protein